MRSFRDRWYAAESRLQAIEAAGKPKLLSQAIEVLLTDEQRPGAPATFTFEQFMQIMAASVRKTRGGRSAGERLDATRVG